MSTFKKTRNGCEKIVPASAPREPLTFGQRTSMLFGAVLALLMVPVVSFAQSTASVTDVVASSDWTAILSDIVSALTAVMIPVIGLAVGLMLVAILFRVLKKFLSAGK